MDGADHLGEVEEDLLLFEVFGEVEGGEVAVVGDFGVAEVADYGVVKQEEVVVVVFYAEGDVFGVVLVQLAGGFAHVVTW